MAELVHPERPLARGFARVTSRSGKTLTRAQDAKSERLLTLHFGDGPIDATVDGVTAAPAIKRTPGRSNLSQPGLFDRQED
jgi:exodeoxyribonuclease VII large subunit